MKLGIYGAGGMGPVLLRVANLINACDKLWDEIIFVDDVIPEKEAFGCAVFPYQEVLHRFSTDNLELIISVGEPTARAFLYNRCKSDGYRFATLMDPTIDNKRYSEFGEGVFVNLGAVISPNSKIGNNVLILTNASIGHDVSIGNHSVVCAQTAVSGFVSIGESSFIGAGSNLADHITLGSNVVVCLGTAVSKSLPDGAKVMGNPARQIPNNTRRKVF